MINYAIPGFYELANFNLKFLDIFNSNRELFYDDINIEAVYGNPQFCIWDGGRIFPRYYQATTESVQNLIELYNLKFNLPIRYIFTNNQLQEKDYKDRFCNILMNIAQNGKNQVVVADDNLFKYLKTNYPKFKYISSTTKCLRTKELVYEELEKDYNLMCLDYNFNKNLTFLNEIQQKDKIELLINPICDAMCPFRKDHYYLNSISHLNYGKKYTMEDCYITEDLFYPSDKCRQNNLTYEEIKEKYAPLGYEHFKIEGRTWSDSILAITYVEYMVKPEYKNYVLTILLN